VISRLQGFLAISVSILCFATGCSGGGDGLFQCTGEVTLDGQRLSDGTIEFRPADARGPTAGALIKDGKFEVRMAPGTKVVVIEAFRTTGQQHADPKDPESPLVPILKKISLPEYSEASQTTIDIARGDAVNFQLRSSR